MWSGHFRAAITQAGSNYRVADAVALAAVAAAAAAVDVARLNASLFRHKNVACFALFTKCARRSTLLCKEGCTIYPKMAMANDDDWPAKEEERSGVALATGNNNNSNIAAATIDNLLLPRSKMWGCKCCQLLFVCRWQLVSAFIVYGNRAHTV